MKKLDIRPPREVVDYVAGICASASEATYQVSGTENSSS